MWQWIKKSKSIKDDLLNFKDEPLSRLSIIFLIVLDIFIFTNVNIGVDAERAKVPKPYSYYPYDCTKHFKEIQTEYDGFNSYTYRNSYTPSSNAKSPHCQELEKKIDVFASTSAFKENHKSIKSIEKKQRKNSYRMEQINDKYNTRLFEHIAKLSNNKALREAKNEYDTLILDNKKLKNELKNIPSVNSLKGFKEYKDYLLKNKELYFEAKESYIFWRPFKAYGYMLLFILPLLFIFGFFYRRSNRKKLRNETYNPVVKIISAHISVILALPLIWYTFTLIYHVMPKTLLKNVINFLVDIGLLSLLNYFAIFLVVLLFGGIIYFIQKRTLKHKEAAKEDKNPQKLISLSQCFGCASIIDYSKNFCPFCGEKLHETCSSCQKPTVIHETFCSHCGIEKEGLL